MDMTKILFVSNTANFAKFNRPLMRWCESQGWQVDYCAPDDEIISDCHKHYVLPISRNPFSKGSFDCIKRLRKILEENQYDIIHCHTPMGSVVARIAAKKLWKQHKVKVIYTAHGYHFYKGAPLLNWLLYYNVEKICSRFTDAIITLNQEDYDNTVKRFKCKNTIKIDGVGVDLTRFKPAATEQKLQLRAEKGFDAKDFILIYVAEFISRKNHKLLLEVFKNLKERIPNLKLILAGKGTLLDYYKDFVKQNNLEDSITFTGYTKETDKYYQISDVCMSTSFQEGLPISLIEALGTGLPLVASEIRGHVDVIETGKNGYLCKLNTQDSVKQFTDAVMKLYENPELRLEIGKNNVADSTKYEVESAVKVVSDLYKKILEN